jgi:dimethylargininase
VARIFDFTLAILRRSGASVVKGLRAASGIFAGYRVFEVPAGEEGGANVLRVRDSLLVGATHPRIAELVGGLGVDVIALDNAKIARIDAGLTCISLRWRA